MQTKTLQRRVSAFLAKSRGTHGDRYDYSLVEYVNSKVDVTIKCVIHGPFNQNPNAHARGSGCPECAQLQRPQTLLENYGVTSALQSPLLKRKKEHTMVERYGVSHPSYSPELCAKREHTMLERHGVCSPFSSPQFQQSSRDTMIERYGHPYSFQSEIIRDKIKQSMIEKYGHPFPHMVEEITEKRRTTNMERYGVEYIGSSDIVREKIAATIVERYGVSNHGQLKIQHVLHLVNDEDWLFDQYVTQHKTADQISRELGCLDSNGICNYLRRYEIAIRITVGYSISCVNWLNSLMEVEGINIQHAINGGEYRIPGTRYRADGYCEATNTIYEFHGDAFHGNPAVYSPTTRCHPFNKEVTANELFQSTLAREQILIDLGYKLIIIWESEWNLAISSTE